MLIVSKNIQQIKFSYQNKNIKPNISHLYSWSVWIILLLST
jgi:hypothetical protein